MKPILVILITASAFFSEVGTAATETGSGSGSNKVSACQRAKEDARQTCDRYHGVVGVEKYEKCVCDQKSNSSEWECTVDAYCAGGQAKLQIPHVPQP